MAAAEVLVRGCCSNLNKTKHHLVSPWPPPLLTTSDIKAEFLSPVQKSGQVTSRILFCNTRGCNRRGVPWSSPQRCVLPFSFPVNLLHTAIKPIFLQKQHFTFFVIVFSYISALCCATFEQRCHRCSKITQQLSSKSIRKRRSVLKRGGG